MADPADRIDQWQRDHDPEPARQWNGIPFNGAPVPTINPVADVVSRAVTGDLSRHDADAQCGLLLMRGVPAEQCQRIAAYVTADRDTLLIHQFVAYDKKFPDNQWAQLRDWNTPPARGWTWDLYAAA